MRIYYAASITGGRDQLAVHPIVLEQLRDRGTVLTEHVGSGALDGAGETSLAAAAIYRRDVDWLDEADVLVAEVTTPSLGVGYEIGRAEARGLPVLALFDERSGRRLSAMISGNPRVVTVRYASASELMGAIAHFFDRLPRA